MERSRITRGLLATVRAFLREFVPPRAAGAEVFLRTAFEPVVTLAAAGVVLASAGRRDRAGVMISEQHVVPRPAEHVRIRAVARCVAPRREAVADEDVVPIAAVDDRVVARGAERVALGGVAITD